MSSNIKRVFSFAASDFYRNKGISISAIFVLVMTILLVTGIFFIHGISNHLIATIEDKIDITAYFKEDTSEQDILNAKEDISKNAPNVKSVEYVSRDEALKIFLARHEGSDVYAKALTQVGENPFLPSLNIKTTGSSADYESVANILENSQYKNTIAKVDFSEKKATIDKIFSFTNRINWIGLILGLVMVLVAVSVVLNTIKLIINNSKEEIGTMKIVGASDWFVKAPFIIQGGMFGLIAFAICILLTVLTVFLSSNYFSILVPDFSLIGFFFANFLLIILIQLAFGVGLGVLSSWIVVRKYLKV